MKLFKTIDCLVQLLLILGALFFNLIIAKNAFDEGFFMSYVLIGSWQIISLIVHFFFPAEYKIGLRRVYSILLLLTAIVFLVGLFDSGLLIGILYVLLFWSPILAILYLITCLVEYKKTSVAVS